MRRTLVALSLGLSLLIPQIALAGGGPIEIFNVIPSIENPWSRIPEPGTQYTAHVRVQTPNSDPYDTTKRWCESCIVKFKLENPQPDDYIMQNSDKTGSGEDGSVYAKIISHIPGKRYLYAEVTWPNGPTQKSSWYVLNYTGTSQWDPQEYITPTTQPQITTVALPSAQPTVPQSSDQVQPKTSEAVKATVKTTPQVKVQPSETADPRVEELNKKVEDLQNKLEESQVKQNALELRLNQISSWLSSIFPFLKF